MSTRNKKNLEQNTNNTKEYMSHNKKFVWGLDSGSAREKVFLRYKVRSFFHESYFSIKQLRSSGLMVFSLIKTCFPMPLGKLNVQVLRDKLAESPRLQMTKTTVLCCSTCTKLCQCTVRFNQNCKLLKKNTQVPVWKVQVNLFETCPHQSAWVAEWICGRPPNQLRKLFCVVYLCWMGVVFVVCCFDCFFLWICSCFFLCFCSILFFLEPKRGRSI